MLLSHRLKLIVLALGLTTLAGIAYVRATATAASSAGIICSGSAMDVARVYGPDARLVAAFDASVASVVAWQELPDPAGGRMTSPYRVFPATDRLIVCYYDGSFTHIAVGHAPVPPGVQPPPPPQYERLVLIVGGDGRPTLSSVGPRGETPIVDPGAVLGSTR
jgi:hypothetical protein